MIAWICAFIAWWTRRRVAYAGAGVVAGSNAAISFLALSATTRALGVPTAISLLFPFGADGVIAVLTPVTMELRDAPWWVKAQAWGMLLAAIAVSVVGNAARAPRVWTDVFGVPVPTGDAVWLSIPPLAYAGALHALGLMHRYAPPISNFTTHTSRASVRSGRAAPVERARRASARRREAPVVLPDGRTVSAGHARKLRAALTRASEAA